VSWAHSWVHRAPVGAGARTERLARLGPYEVDAPWTGQWVGPKPPSRRTIRGRAPSVYDLNGKQGTELAEVIVEKIKAAVNAITFK
jgi:hypothetical protein